MIPSLLLAALCLLPSPDVVVDSVDLVEINHFYDEWGKLVFDQVIFYTWSGDERRYQVRAWRLFKIPAQRPQRIRGEYEAIWHDGEVLRRVRAGAIIEDWSLHDEEMRQRSVLPVDSRKKLTKPFTMRSE